MTSFIFAGTSKIVVYTAHTPNGVKIPIVLEERGCPSACPSLPRLLARPDPSLAIHPHANLSAARSAVEAYRRLFRPSDVPRGPPRCNIRPSVRPDGLPPMPWLRG
jgi:hypothetical protein